MRPESERRIQYERLSWRIRAQNLTRYGLGAARVGDADELLDQAVMLVVVPVAKNDSLPNVSSSRNFEATETYKLLVVLVGLVQGMNYDRCTHAVDIVSLGQKVRKEPVDTNKYAYTVVRVPPVGTDLSRSVDCDLVREVTARRNTADRSHSATL